MSHNNSGSSKSILMKLFPVDEPQGRGDNAGTIFRRPALKICQSEKNVQNSAHCLTTIDFDREYLRNRSSYRRVWKKQYQLQSLPRWAKKIGELWSTNNRVKVAHIDQPKWTFFGRLDFGSQGVLHPEIFTHARDWPKQPSAHPNWDRGPPKKF